MKLYLYLLILLLAAPDGIAQPCYLIDMQYVIGNPSGKVYFDNQQGYSVFKRDYDTLVTDVLRAAGLQFAQLRIARATNSTLYTDMDGFWPTRPAIYFHKAYFDTVKQRCNLDNDAVKTLIAHELGHILSHQLAYMPYTLGTPQYYAEQRKREEFADGYAGYLCCIMGIPVCTAIRAIFAVTPPGDNNNSNDRHPVRSKRMAAIIDGYKLAMKEVYKDTNHIAIPIIVDNPLIAATYNIEGNSTTALLNTLTPPIADSLSEVVVITSAPPPPLPVQAAIYNILGPGILTVNGDNATLQDTTKTVTLKNTNRQGFVKRIEIREKDAPRKQQKQSYYLAPDGTIWGNPCKDTLIIVGQQVQQP